MADRKRRLYAQAVTLLPVGASDPPTPSAGSRVVYARASDGALTVKNDQGGATNLEAGGGGGAPTTADYLVRTADAGLSAERVVTDTATVTWDWGTAGQAKAAVPAASTSAQGVVELATSAETTAGLVVQASDTRLSDSRAPSGAASGDLGGTYPSPTVTQARGLRETAGPTTLAMGAVPDGAKVHRYGSSLVGTMLGNHRLVMPAAAGANEAYGRPNPTALGVSNSAAFQAGRRWRLSTTSTTANNTAGWTGAASSLFASNLNPVWETELKTGSDITSIRLYAGMADGVPSATADDYGGTAQVVAARYCPGSDTYWTLYTQAGSTGTINKVASSVTPAADTVYRLRLVLTTTTAELWIDVGGTGTYTLAASTSTSIPAADAAMGDFVRVSNTVGAARSIYTGWTDCHWRP